MKAILTIGPPGSGKTTFAENLDNSWVNINRDDLRFTITGCKNWGEYKFTKDVERMVSDIQDAMMVSSARVGKNVIISDTNLNPKTRERLEPFLKGLGYTIEHKVFDVDFDTLLKRNLFRERGVPYEVLLDMYIRFQRYKGVEAYKPDTSKPPAIVFDIDGTLADKGKRSPFDFSKVDQDKPIAHVVDMEFGYRSLGYKTLFLSGRESSCRRLTEEWLDQHLIDALDTPLHLFMRQTKDPRKDYIVKMELFNKHVAPNYNVLAVVDDRKQVIEQCWGVLEVPVINVGNNLDRF